MLDGHMNHSCEPNTYSINEIEFEGGGQYDTVCIRDIKEGAEITCDYDFFEWDCQDKGIDACGCKTPSCRGRVWGFKHLSADQQKPLLGFALPAVLTELKKEGIITPEQHDHLQEKRAQARPADFA